MNIDLKVRGTDGFTKAIITDAGCVINLFAPPKDPQSNPGDRMSPDYVVTATYNSSLRYYIATISTTGWASGTWWMQGVISGGSENYNAFDFESFILNPLCAVRYIRHRDRGEPSEHAKMPPPSETHVVEEAVCPWFAGSLC